MSNPPSHAQAVARVAEYVRQRDMAMSGGNVGDVITTVYADPEAQPADLDVRDLRVLVGSTGAPADDFLLKDRLTQAVHDPGSIIGRRLGPSWGEGQPGYAEEPETLWDWVVRAVYHVVHPPHQTEENGNGNTH